MSVDFRELLKKKADDAKRPPAWPAGHYYGKLGKFVLGDQNKNNTPYVRFSVQATGPGDDIDPTELQDEDGKPIDITKRNFTRDFFLTPEADYRLTEFIKSLGIDTTGRDFAELLPETTGADVIFELSKQPSQNAEAKPGDMVNFITAMTGVQPG
jgi:hypothetical protein